MSDYLPDVSTLFYLAMATGILAASLLIGIMMGAMIRKGGSDRPDRGLLAPFGDFARWVGRHPAHVAGFALGVMIYQWWKL